MRASSLAGMTRLTVCVVATVSPERRIGRRLLTGSVDRRRGRRLVTRSLARRLGRPSSAGWGGASGGRVVLIEGCLSGGDGYAGVLGVPVVTERAPAVVVGRARPGWESPGREGGARVTTVGPQGAAVPLVRCCAAGDALRAGCCR
ncbi:hypothetical protein GCM10018781_13170 [Kitasatospora indigofera]|uniref:Uncharacterized protein n=1 Tax=Kitasatospora indigofera TaxID=67307 RepID=A0A919FER7_9ACTN|nr:hypothetical protein GCM10018781_13170 [Kitasatospora indigofera]